MIKGDILITIPPSHYCEKVRWAMDYSKVNFSEKAYPPAFHLLGTKRYKGGSTPLLITNDGVFKDSTDILKYLDSKLDDKSKLYTNNEKTKKEVEELEELFDTQLGVHSRRWAYYYLFKEKPDLIKKAMCIGEKPFIENIFKILFPTIKKLMIKSMNINEKSMKRSKDRIDEVFHKVEELLKDGREYLVGDTFTVADLTLASLAIPVIVPKQYKYLELNELPDEMKKEVLNYRNSLTGQYILKTFERRKISI